GSPRVPFPLKIYNLRSTHSGRNRESAPPPMPGSDSPSLRDFPGHQTGEPPLVLREGIRNKRRFFFPSKDRPPSSSAPQIPPDLLKSPRNGEPLSHRRTVPPDSYNGWLRPGSPAHFSYHR